MHWSEKKLISFRVDPRIWKTLQRRAADEGALMQTVLEHAIVHYLNTVPLDREHSPCER